MSQLGHKARERMLQLWENAIRLHQRLKTDPALQFVGDLIKLMVLVLRLVWGTFFR